MTAKPAEEPAGRRGPAAERAASGGGAKRWLAVPLLFAAHPLLSFYQHNIDQVSLGDLVPALAASCAAAAALSLVAWAWLKRPEAAAVAASALVAAFFWYGHLYDLAVGGGLGVRASFLGVPITTNVLLTSVLVLVLAGLLAAIARGRFPVREAARLAAVVGATLVVSAAVLTAAAGASLARAGSSRASGPGDAGSIRSVAATRTAGKARTPEEYPDVYFIVLDRYTGLESLREVSGYDNSPLLEELEDRGFFVARGAYSNYSVTYLSLAATLNMRYLQEYTDLPAYRKHEGAPKVDRGPFYEMLADNEVARTLQERGYRYVHLTSGWAATDSSPIADQVVDTERDSEFVNVLAETTWARGLAARSETGGKRERVLRTFASLDALREPEEPVFVFAHIMVPHPPYVFAADGTDPGLTPEQLQADPSLANRAYVEQLRYTNELLTGVLPELAKERGRPVAVILQGDHGVMYRSGESGSDLQLKRRKHSILSACYVSDGMPAGLYDEVSPVNTFRLLFDEWFGTGLGQLPDRSFYSSTEKWPYWPAEVTEEIREAGRP